MYKSEEYWNLTKADLEEHMPCLLELDDDEEGDTHRIDPDLLRCPFCIHMECCTIGHRQGDIRHMHLYCQHPALVQVRTKLGTHIELAAQAYIDGARSLCSATWLDTQMQALWTKLQALELTARRSMMQQCNAT